MGTPCSKNSKAKYGQRGTSIRSRSSFSDRDDFLKFKVEIGHIKARNLPAASSYINIHFGDQKSIRTAEMTNNSKNYSWRLHEEFEYTCSKKELKEDTITLHLMNKLDKEIGAVSISLYDIATGPSHQDFVLKMKKGRIDPCRLNFDVKMSQLIYAIVKPESIHCKMLSNLREKFYNFSLRMNTKEREFSSEHSTNVTNIPMGSFIAERIPEELGDENYQLYMDENKKVKMKYFSANKVNRNFQKMRNDYFEYEPETSETSKFDDESLLRHPNLDRKLSSKPSGVLMLEKKLSMTGHSTGNLFQGQWAPKKDLIWKYNDENAPRPVLDMNISVRELATGIFQLFLWANKDGLNKSTSEEEDSDFSEEEVYIDHKLVGECFIGMNKFFFGDDEANCGEVEGKTIVNEKEDKHKHSHSYKRSIKLTEKLLFHGEHVGELTAEFVIENSAFFKQMIFGVRTEEGIQKSSSLYLKSKAFPLSFKSTDVKEIKTLSQLKDNLKTTSFNLYGQKVTPKIKIKLIDDLATSMLKVHDILKTSHQDSLISVLYKTPENLMLSQKILIGLTKHALENCDEVPNSLRPVYFETLLMLIHRAEFELNYMGFDESYEEFLKNAQKTSFKNDATGPKADLKNIQQKLKVCESYQALLYHALQKVLNKMSQKGLPDKEREFVEHFTAIAYFRIPEFRERLLNTLKKDVENVEIPELRGLEWGFGEHLIENKNQHLFALFDWERNFYVYLKNTEEGESNYKLLGEILEDRDWKNRLGKKGIAFYSFLTEWARHVNKTVVTKDHVPWQDLPGYTTLVKAFLAEMKSKDVRRYPSALLNASYSLLKNEKLLNVFIAIAYNKTRIHDSFNVFAVFELINSWFGVLRENKKSVGATFDNSYFCKGMFLVLEGDHALNIAKVLWVIYNNFNVFPYTLKEQLSEYFFGNIFFKLFLHWSWNVRQVFHHLLIYRFYHQHRQSNTNLSNVEDLRKELLKYNQKRENYYKTKEKFVNEFINMEYSRHMTIIENAYKKYKQEKQERAQRSRAKSSWESVKKPNYRKTSILPEISEFSTDTRQILPLAEYDSGRKDEYFPRLKLKISSSEKRDIENNIVDDFFEPQEKMSRKQSLPTNGEPSYWLINTDNLELSMQGPVNRISRSESLNLTPTSKKELEMMRQDDMNSINIDVSKKNSEEIDYVRPRGSSIRGSLQAIPEDRKSNNKKTVIHRRLMYFDRQTKKLKEIPKECAVYLEYAYKEYEQIKEQYVKWYGELQKTLASLPEEQAKKIKADPKVPELNVKIPLDEDGQGDIEEW